ncbi:hypothetical protein EBT25_18915, partial [bacterium]|nr:hypothetical protein [bacterium]
MKCCWTDQEPPLYVILPYFNFCGFRTRKRLFEDFVNRYKDTPGVRFVVVEASPLPKLPVWKQIKVQTKHVLWLKENLINIGAAHLPPDWKYIAWIDADILFLNADWVDDTKEALEFFDVVQLFQSAVNLGPRGETIKVDKSFGYMHSQSGTPYVLSDKYGFWHPGYAWACTRKAWNTMGGLVDWAILGSADRHMALAWIGKSELSRPGTIHENYKKLLADFEEECKGFRVGNINGTILHEWHGSLANRKYKERWNILTQNNFDPVTDLGLSKGGVIQLTKMGVRMETEMKKYFQERFEDS